MTKKRLLIIFCILILIVAIVVLNSTVFTLQKANVIFVTYDADTKATLYVDAPEKYAKLSSEKLIQKFKGKNLLFLSESELVDAISLEYPDLQVIAAKRIFPDCIDIYLTQREPVAYFEKDGYYYLVDSDMYVLERSSSAIYGENYVYLDVSQYLTANQVIGTLTSFVDSDEKAFILSEAFSAIWRTKYENVEMHNFVEKIGFSAYNGVDNVVMQTKTGANIWIVNPKLEGDDIFEKVKAGVSIYSSNANGRDNTVSGVEINRPY